MLISVQLLCAFLHLETLDYAHIYLRISLGYVTGSKEYATLNALHLMVEWLGRIK